MSTTIDLGFAGFSYEDLYLPSKLADLLAEFDRYIATTDAELSQRYLAYRADQGASLNAEDTSELLTAIAPIVGAFVATLFGVEDQREQKIKVISEQFDTIFRFKKEIVEKLKSWAKKTDFEALGTPLHEDELEQLIAAIIPLPKAATDLELRFCTAATALHELVTEDVEGEDLAAVAASLREVPVIKDRIDWNDTDHALLAFALDLLKQWSHQVVTDRSFAPHTQSWVAFKSPAKTDFNDLVEHDLIDNAGYSAWEGPKDHRRRRDGFGLTDPRFPERRVLYEVDHCIYCHERDTDSCSKGMRNKKTNEFKTNPLGVTVIGCPLGEKISEMHLVKRQGDDIGALALVMIDNPMCPGTGHRICNDCMKGCIYQKTEPVNIPQIETNVLVNVLDMPWGFEIYGLLARFNPLNVKRPHALPFNGKKVLVTGLGPAGYTLAHYLINEGFGVVGIDALKLEPLDESLTGTSTRPPRPIRDYAEIKEKLDERVLLGFGGVAEYGITVRWDKNFLKVIYLTLLRRETFRAYGGVRLGGTLTVEEAWDLGFDHVAIATGAGKPTIIGIKNNLCRGIRKASDFLMALQLTGAAKTSSLANLQVRLPAGVIGGGLTAIDTTTEVMAYYPIQVEKVLTRYEQLCAIHGERALRSGFDEEELEILDEFVNHGRAVVAERSRAASAGECPDFAPLIESWGGVTLFYRKGVKDSPAYRQNHEEIREALEESIAIAEGMQPVEAIEDKYGALDKVRFERASETDGSWKPSGVSVDVPLKSLFVAAGTSPNTIYEQEYPGSFAMADKFF